MQPADGKELPLFSPLNLLLAAAATVILVIVVIISGNRIFNPGPLSAAGAAKTARSSFGSHADFEQDCQLCHQPLRGRQAVLCMDCHMNVGEQVAQKSGVHGPMANSLECRDCHPDHRGREFAMADFARGRFDHAATGFPLDPRHARAACQDCHAPESGAPSGECAACHAEPEVHAGIFSTDCGECHQGQTWQEATWQGRPFDHELTGFSLRLHQTDYTQMPITCTDCHLPLSAAEPEFACQDCHTRWDTVFMVGHVQSFGSACLECHDGVDRMKSFDHAAVFPIAGRHAELSCADCHTGQPFREAETVCATCHEEPEIHAGFFGLRCQMCHTDIAWQPARLTIHAFPLDHGSQGELSCEACHAGPYTEYSCYLCHEHREDEMAETHLEAGIPVEQLADCAACHMDGQVHEQQP